MKKLILFVLLIINCLVLYSSNTKLSNSAYISLLTCGAGDEIYELYGHTAIRVKDSVNGIDDVFNYGSFDFNSPNFIYRFMKGETDYYLEIDTFDEFLKQYQQRITGITEQILNFIPFENQEIYNALIANNLPENKFYRYNFLYDNCSTRPRIIFEKYIKGKIQYKEILPQTTFRELIHNCNKNHQWIILGIDFILGSPADKTITQKEQLFLPDKLMHVFDSASITNLDGISKPLISKKIELTPNLSSETHELSKNNPAFIFWLFFGFIIVLSLVELLLKKHFIIFDFSLFLIIGLLGCLLFLMIFLSEHPATSPNYLFLCFHPLHLFATILLFLPCIQKIKNIYYFLNTCILLLVLCSWFIFPQKFNPAILPFTLIFLIRSFTNTFFYHKLLNINYKK